MFLLTCDKKLTKSQLSPTHASTKRKITEDRGLNVFVTHKPKTVREICGLQVPLASSILSILTGCPQILCRKMSVDLQAALSLQA